MLHKEYPLRLFFTETVLKTNIDSANIAVAGQGEMDVNTSDIVMEDDHTVKIPCSDLTSLPSGAEVTCTLKLKDCAQTFSLHLTVMERLAVKSSNISNAWNTVGKIQFNQRIEFVDGTSAFANIVKKGETNQTVGKAEMTFDPEDGTCKTLLVEMPMALEGNDYTLVIESNTVQSAITRYNNDKAEIDFSTYGTPKMQNTNPMNNAFVENCPKFVFFMFNKDIEKTNIESAVIAVEGRDEIVVDADSEIYTDGALIQISGRVGRKMDAYDGEVIFLCNQEKENVLNAIKKIKEANEYVDV